MWKKIHRFVQKHNIISKGDRILLGLSGGADSVLLARYLLSLREEGEIQLYAVHVNHLLRNEEAFRDQRFVEDFCQRWQIPLDVYQEDVRSYATKEKMSLEEAGRVLRYLRMEESCQKYHCNKIGLAHHKDDLAETMVFRMIRGTGPQGLSGIQAISDGKIRPLLSVDKKEILGILSEISQDYVDDSTNDELEYSRNFIRHRIMPLFSSINDQAVSHMAQLSDYLMEQNSYLEKQMDALYESKIERPIDGIRMQIMELQRMDPFARKEMLRRMLFEACGQKKDIGTIQVEQLEELLWKKEGKKISLPYKKIAILVQSFLFLGKQEENKGEKESREFLLPMDYLNTEGRFSVILEDMYSFSFSLLSPEKCEINKNDCVKYFDYDKIRCGISIRTRKEGDFFVMDISGKRKRLKRFFIDEKIPASLRDKIYLLADGNHVLWIAGGRISEEYKITESTRNVLKMEYHLLHT